MTAMVRFRIEEMDCAEEVEILKREVGEVAGVLDLDFDLLNRRLTVNYDPDRTGPDALRKSIAATGMKAVPWEYVVEEITPSAWQRYGRPGMACISGVLLLGGFSSHLILHGSVMHALVAGHSAGHTLPLVSIIFYLGSIITGAWFVAPRALAAARRFRPDMNLLMTVAVIGAVTIGEWLEAAMVTFLFAVALLLEHWSVGHARKSIKSLLQLSPSMARLLDPETGRARKMPAEKIPVGAVLVVHPGEKVPLDGEVTGGSSTVNQAPITGESIPSPKGPGDEVFAGTINEDGVLEMRVTREASHTTLARIISLVQEAHSRRAPSEQRIERFARYYTPAMILLALAIALLPPLFSAGPWLTWIYRGLVILVIGCPCALVISTPVSIVAGLTTAARNGILIKGGVYLETAGRLQCIALDKTGTLTVGRPEVQEVIALSGHDQKELLELAGALEAHSEHPLARAIRRRAASEGIDLVSAEDFRAMRGKGAEGKIGGRIFWIGSHRLMEEKGVETGPVHNMAEALEASGCSVVAVGNQEHVCGLISIADSLRSGARDVLNRLSELGVRKLVMLTGDNEGTARAVAREAGVDEYQAELLPEDKVKAVESLVRELDYVAMVGDGVNDAPALAVATVGVAMAAAGSDAAIEAADIALMSDDLSRLPWLIRHSRRTLRVINQNIAFALGLKLTFILLAFLGAASLWMAIAADMGASLLVIFNSLRLLNGGEG